MDHYQFDDIELAFEIHGSGQRVVLIHASPFVSWYEPLLPHLEDANVLVYRRYLRKEERADFRPLSAIEDAAICGRLMDHVGWSRAHLVGHSYGALVVLALATRDMDKVHTASLLEPALREISSSEQVVAALAPIFRAYGDGEPERAMDLFLQHVGGTDYRKDLDRLLPGAFADAVAEADLFFQSEMAAVRSFEFSQSQANRITRPVLNVVGESSVVRFAEGAALVQSWFPHAERLTIPQATHLLMIQNPSAVGDGLLDFFERHPLIAYPSMGTSQDRSRSTSRSLAATSTPGHGDRGVQD
jgi:pimeloyl-ACP methyl ester carboxylesterase